MEYKGLSRVGFWIMRYTICCFFFWSFFSFAMEGVLSLLKELKLKPQDITKGMNAGTWARYADYTDKNPDQVLYFENTYRTARWFDKICTDKSNYCLFHRGNFLTIRLNSDAGLSAHQKERLHTFFGVPSTQEGKEDKEKSSSMTSCVRCKSTDVPGTMCACGAMLCQECRVSLGEGSVFFRCPSCPALRRSLIDLTTYVRLRGFKMCNVTKHMTRKRFAKYLKRTVIQPDFVAYFYPSDTTQELFTEQDGYFFLIHKAKTLQVSARWDSEIQAKVDRFLGLESKHCEMCGTFTSRTCPGPGCQAVQCVTCVSKTGAVFQCPKCKVHLAL